MRRIASFVASVVVLVGIASDAHATRVQIANTRTDVIVSEGGEARVSRYPKLIEVAARARVGGPSSLVVGAAVVALVLPRGADEGAPHVDVPTFVPPPVAQTLAVTTTTPSGAAPFFWR